MNKKEEEGEEEKKKASKDSEGAERGDSDRG